MRGIVGYVVGAAILALLGSICLAASRLERQMAGAQQAMVTQDDAESDATLETAERYYQYASRLPGVGAGPLNDVRARKAARQYWQREYGGLLPADQPNPVEEVAPDNVQLQLVVANALYRSGQARAKDRATTLEILNAGIDAYRAVLNNAERQEDAPYLKQAAHNYEYLVRLRDEPGRRRRDLPPPGTDRPLGAEGEAEESKPDEEFKTYVPLQKEEREEGEAGQESPRGRKG